MECAALNTNEDANEIGLSPRPRAGRHGVECDGPSNSIFGQALSTSFNYAISGLVDLFAGLILVVADRMEGSERVSETPTLPWDTRHAGNGICFAA